jgi:hypothetical protein
MEPIPTPPNPFVAADGRFTLPSIEECFFVPGDWLVYLLTSRFPSVAELFGVGAADYGGTLAAFLAWTSWVLLAVAAIAASAAVRRFDRALTGQILYVAAEIKRHFRMAIAFTRYRQQHHRRKRKEPTFDGEEPSLSRNEARVLELHAKLAPGFALAVSDVVEDLDLRAHEARAVLERLQKLKLLHATVGGLDGDPAYTLTSSGRALVQMVHARPKHA